jgi:hypothetical protein
VADRPVLLGDDEGHCRERTRGSAPTMSPRTPIGHDLIEQLGALEAVDAPAKGLSPSSSAAPRRPRRSTRPCRAPGSAIRCHPLLIVVPMGSWISAVVLDWLGGKDARRPRHPARRRPRRRDPDGRHRLRRLGRHRAGQRPRAPHRHRPRRRQRHRRRPVRASLAARAGGARGKGKLLALLGSARWARRATSAATSRTPRASASTPRRSRTTPRTGRRRSPTPRWARAR